MKKELTPWFEADVKPAREGLYQREYVNDDMPPDLWTGERWMLCSSGGTPFTAARTLRPWRGLASDPKASKP